MAMVITMILKDVRKNTAGYSMFVKGTLGKTQKIDNASSTNDFSKIFQKHILNCCSDKLARLILPHLCLMLQLVLIHFLG